MMSIPKMAATSALFFLLFSGSIALALPACDPSRDAVLKSLHKKYGESVTDRGITAAGAMLEVLTDPVDGSWSIIVTIPGGETCLVGVGDGWRNVTEVSLDPAI